MKTSCWRDRDDGDHSDCVHHAVGIHARAVDSGGCVCVANRFVVVVEPGENQVRDLMNMLWGALLDWIWYAGIPAVTIMSFGLLIVGLIKFIA